MSFNDFMAGKSSHEAAWERKQAEEALLRAEHDQHEALLGALRAFGADLPTGDELFKRWGIDRKAKKQG